MRTIRFALSLAAILTIARAFALAAPPDQPGAPAAAAPVSGFRAEFLYQLDDVEKKLVGLAQATPDSKFAWRPADGVRSISEVYTHIAGGNYFVLSFLDIKPPASLGDLRNLEKTVTQKAAVIDALQQSMEHVRKAVRGTSDADLEKKVQLFGRPATARAVFFAVANHMHEHLGQSIAYARMNGVVPPWSAAEPSPPAKASGK